MLGGSATLAVELGDHVTLRAFLTGSHSTSGNAVRAYGAVSGGLGLTSAAAGL